MRKLITFLVSTSLLVGCAATVEPDGFLQPTPTVPAESEPPPTFDVSTLRIDTELCKFEDRTADFLSRNPWMDFTYFPNVQTDPYHLPSIGEGNLALVFLDWVDMPGGDEERSYYLEQAEILAKWYELVSQGKYSISWRVSDEWSRLPGSWKDWKRGDFLSDAELDPLANQALLNAAVEATDASFDYSDIDYVIYAIPKSGSLMLDGTEKGDVVFPSAMQGFESFIHPNPDSKATSVNSKEGSIGNWALAGTTFQDTENRSPSWVFWAHEMGHMFGYVSHAFQPELGGGGSQFYANPMSPAGLFANQWYPVRAVSGWTSWVAGWLDDEQIQCVEGSEIRDEVFAVNNRREVNGSTKAVIIRTGETTGLVIESREWDSAIDTPTSKGETGFYDGILMYYIDSSRPISDESLIPLMPHGTKEVVDSELRPGPAISGMDSMFQEGESAEYKGLRIEVLSMQDGVDYVRVSRIEG
jgi:M6 family metalloprotease-like protein